jgi:hypothetical protein
MQRLTGASHPGGLRPAALCRAESEYESPTANARANSYSETEKKVRATGLCNTENAMKRLLSGLTLAMLFATFMPPRTESWTPALMLTPVHAVLDKQLEDPSASHNAPYHEHPPTEPLPATLDPVHFHDNRRAYVTYSLAPKIRDVLYQEPCFCECRKLRGHQSLLDCYTSTHGEFCEICQLEVVFCFERHKQGWSTKQIRQSMLRREWTTVKLEQYVNDFQKALAEHK